MLMPRKVKHRKQQRGRMGGKAKGGSDVTFGDFGIQALEPAWLTARQIEAARIAMTRHVQARRQGLDPGLPRSAGHPEAGGDPYGFGQGKSGPLGGGREARPDHLRVRRCRAGACPRGDGPGNPEAPHQGPLRHPPGTHGTQEVQV